MFESDFLEGFSHVHPATPGIMWVPLILWLGWRSFAVHQMSLATAGALAALGFFVWTLTEYALHRWVFHYIGQSKLSARIHFMIHGVHHDAPEDATRLVMPPAAALLLAVALYTVFRVLFGPVFVEPFFASFLVGYLVYDYTHYYIHHFKPRTRLGRFIKQHHMLHHFATPEARWGVSSPIWDYVFGTQEQAKQESEQAAN